MMIPRHPRFSRWGFFLQMVTLLPEVAAEIFPAEYGHWQSMRLPRRVRVIDFELTPAGPAERMSA